MIQVPARVVPGVVPHFTGRAFCGLLVTGCLLAPHSVSAAGNDDADIFLPNVVQLESEPWTGLGVSPYVPWIFGQGRGQGRELPRAAIAADVRLAHRHRPRLSFTFAPQLEVENDMGARYAPGTLTSPLGISWQTGSTELSTSAGIVLGGDPPLWSYVAALQHNAGRWAVAWQVNGLAEVIGGVHRAYSSLSLQWQPRERLAFSSAIGRRLTNFRTPSLLAFVSLSIAI